jgi:hypothetical protein
MEPTYVVINQLGQYLNKHKLWISGRDSQLIYRTIHKDEAINQVFEMSSKDIELRARVLIVELDDKSQPIVEPGPQSDAEIEKASGAQHSMDIDAQTDESQESINEETIDSTSTLETTQNEPT